MRSAIVLSLVLVCACPPVNSTRAPLPKVEGLAACTDAAIDGGKQCVTYRAITGASMGGGAAARVAMRHPELFDAVSIMGTPLLDLPALWTFLAANQFSTSGVYDSVPESWDAYVAAAEASGDPEYATPDGQCAAFRSDFAHWYRGTEEGRGNAFDRSYLVQVFDDLVGAYGNPLTSDGAFFQPGVAPDFFTEPSQNQSDDPVQPTCTERAAGNAISREGNPDGALPTIAFCDGSPLVVEDEPGEGDWRADIAHDWALPFALAVDTNEDGVHQPDEPVVLNDRERFTDTDGDRERDDDEPFDDDGLDGVPGTADFGEGDGAFTESEGLAHWRAESPRTLLAQVSDAQLERVSIFIDAGIRDFLNSAQLTNRFWRDLSARTESAGRTARYYQGFEALPGISGGYEASDLETDAKTLGNVAYLQYGDPAMCPASDDRFGDGNHVGPDVLDRIFTTFTFAAARIPQDDRRSAIGGIISTLGSPNGELSDYAFLDTYDSDVLGTSESFGVMLPPDYFLDPERRYPVIYFLHGQGNSAQELVGIGLIMWSRMKESMRPDRQRDNVTDMQRAILVFPDGECRLGRCFTGTFYADFAGLPRDDRRFEAALYEVMRTVEARYRTLAPRVLP